MLDLIRNNVQSFGVKFIVGIVVMVMVFFGVSAYNNQGINTIATIDGYEIKLAKYQRAFDQAQNEIRQRFKSQAADYMKMVNLPGQIVQQLVNSALLLKSAEKLGLSVTDHELAEAIFKTQDFQTDNRFDPKKYARMLTNNRIDKLLYEKDLRENLLSEKYIQLLSSGVLVSRQFTDDEYRRLTTKMTIKVIEYKADMFSGNIKLSDEEIRSFYDRNKTDYQQKKQYVISYFPLGVKDTMDKVIVREKEINRYYEKNKNREFSTNASFLSRHILIAAPTDRNENGMIAARNKAEQIYQQLKEQPTRFPLLAKKNSADSISAKNGGMLGWVEKGTFVKEFEEAVAELQKNELSKPFLSNFGYHIVELLDEKPAEIKPFSEVEKRISETIRNRKASRRLDNKVSNLEKQLSDKSLTELASENGKVVVTSKPIDDSQNLENIGFTYQLYQDLKSKKTKDRGHFKLPNDAGVIIYEITEVVDPFIKPLKEVREKVVLLAKSEKAAEIAKTKMVEDQTKTKSVAAFDQLAEQLGVNPQTITFGFSDRQSGEFRISENFRTEVYKMKENSLKAVSDVDQNFLVFLVVKKEDMKNRSDDNDYKGFISELKRQKAGILISSLIGQMKKETEVEYNQSILSALDIKFN